jgi:hypothetical protein
MNADDMHDRGLHEFDLIDITSFARDARIERAVRHRRPQ